MADYNKNEDEHEDEHEELYIIVCADDLTKKEFMNTGYAIEDLHFAIKQIPEATKYELLKKN